MTRRFTTWHNMQDGSGNCSWSLSEDQILRQPDLSGAYCLYARPLVTIDSTEVVTANSAAALIPANVP